MKLGISVEKQTNQQRSAFHSAVILYVKLCSFHISFSFCGYFVGVDAYIDPRVDEGVRPNDSIKNYDAIIRKMRGFVRCVS